jgi:dTDP-4-dehydrorhamnose 3,5-epimerase
MKFTETKIPGVILIDPTVFEDARGYFYESYNAALFEQHGINAVFVQDNQSQSTRGVIRGLHCQLGEHAQAKLVRVLEGAVLDVAVDVRKGSPTYGQYVAVELSAENRRQLFIPRGFLHGFSVLSERATFAYKCDNFYCKAAESGVRYNDPDLNIDWRIPLNEVNVSEKDCFLGSLKDFTNA